MNRIDKTLLMFASVLLLVPVPARPFQAAPQGEHEPTARAPRAGPEQKAGLRGDGAQVRELQPMIQELEPMALRLEPMIRQLEPMTLELEPMIRQLEPLTLGLEPMLQGLEPMTLGLELMVPEPGAMDRHGEARDREQEARDRAQERKDREQELYDRGTEALDEGQWEKAVEAFTNVASLRGSRADAALYWKAYALNKLTRRADALTTLSELQKSYPNSRWMDDAKALELELRQATGKPVSPESESNEDLKLIAVNSLMYSEPERALPILQKLLQGNQPPRVKERALFVLSQNGSPQAHELLAQIARGKADPDLQVKALQCLGMFGGKDSRQLLSDVYASSNDLEVKRAILRSFMVGGERDRLLTAAKSEKDQELRREAIRQLGLMGAHSELWQLYQAEPAVEVKEEILHSLFLGGESERLLEVAKTEKDARLRCAAVQSLGLMGADRTGEALGSLYGAEKDQEVRRAILNGFFIQGNAKALIAIARSEKDPELRKEAVGKLALMNSKEAKDYMLELLNK